MRNARLILPMLLVLGLLTSGLAYAHWEKVITVEGTVTTGTLCAKFVPPVTKADHGLDWTCDEGLVNVRQLNKDVGSSSAAIVADNKIKVELKNVYPSYYEHVSFWIQNCGSIPWKINRVVFNPGNVVITKIGYLTLDLNGDGKMDVEIYWGNNFGTQVDPGEKVDISFEIHVLQDAPQGQTLTFTADIAVCNWNE